MPCAGSCALLEANLTLRHSLRILSCPCHALLDHCHQISPVHDFVLVVLLATRNIWLLLYNGCIHNVDDWSENEGKLLLCRRLKQLGNIMRQWQEQLDSLMR